jgi:hypothetical protein
VNFDLIIEMKISISKTDFLFGDLFYMKGNNWGFDFETKSSIFGK